MCPSSIQATFTCSKHSHKKQIVSFFSFLCQDANKTRSNSAIIGGNLSKKHKLYKTQNAESNYADYKFLFNF